MGMSHQVNEPEMCSFLCIHRLRKYLLHITLLNEPKAEIFTTICRAAIAFPWCLEYWEEFWICPDFWQEMLSLSKQVTSSWQWLWAAFASNSWHVGHLHHCFSTSASGSRRNILEWRKRRLWQKIKPSVENKSFTALCKIWMSCVNKHGKDNQKQSPGYA